MKAINYWIVVEKIKEKPKNWIKHFVSNNRFVNIDTNNFYAVNHYNSLYLQTFKEMNQVKSRIIGTKKQWLNKDLKVKDNATPIYLKRLLSTRKSFLTRTANFQPST